MCANDMWSNRRYVLCMNIALIGYRGSGKTTVGRMLADRLWQKFVDLDELIVEKAGRSIRDIFAQDGESHFRDLETAALREALATPDQVLGLGGGAILREENRVMLQAGGVRTFYLRCEPHELLRRIAGDVQTAEMRPNLTKLGGGIDEIRQVLAFREPIYRQLACAEIDVTNLTPEDVVAHISRML